MNIRLQPFAWFVVAAVLLSAVCVYGQGSGGSRSGERGGGFGGGPGGSPFVPGSSGLNAPSARAGSITSLEARFDPVVVEYVNEKLLKVQDTNKDGNIDKAEWTAAGTWSKSNPPENSDLNKDGKLSREELYIRKSKSEGLPYKAETTPSSPSPSSSNGPPVGIPPGGPSPIPPALVRKDKGEKSAAPAKKSYRFLTPTERLPKGMGDRFLRSDTDGDGQVMMHEFSSNWTEAEAAEFAKYDLDGDGIITPAEGLKMEPKK
jgi:EF hand